MLASKAIRRLSPVILPQGSAILRDMPRPPELRDATYEQLYDFTTVFYDVFTNGNRIFLSGPPLMNLMDVLSNGYFRADVPITNVQLQDCPCGVQRSVITCAQPPHSLSIRNQLLNIEIPLLPDECDVFAGKNVLYTLSKNNRLSWIDTWIRYYRDMHNINAVIVYDNHSNVYSVQDVFKTIRDIPGIDAVRVLSIPFSHGPGGSYGFSDSKFLQSAMLEHVRHRFLLQAAAVINADVDELLMSKTGTPVTETLRHGGEPFITYHGSWIENIPLDPEKEASFANFGFMHKDETKRLYAKKWSIVPALVDPEMIWTTHRLAYRARYVEAEPHPDYYYLHFKGISTHWKYIRRSDAKNIREQYTPCVDWLQIKDAYT